MPENAGDPKLSAYEAVRAHELMLNEAVSRFEHARLAPLIALNGGAVIAFLTLLGVLLGKDSGRHPNLWLSSLAVGAWVLGLVAAALATTAAAEQQRAISTAHRLLREQLEEALVTENRVTTILHGPPPSTKRPSSRLRAHWTPADIKRWWTGDKLLDGQGAGPSSDKTTGDQSEGRSSDKTAGRHRTGDSDRDRDAERMELREIGSIYGNRLKARWWLSVSMFMTGGVLALAAIVSGTPVAKPTQHAETTPRAALTQLLQPCSTDHAYPPRSQQCA